MRLLKTDTLEIVQFHDIPRGMPYAILSHTWGPDNSEVTFQDMTIPALADQARAKPGYAKIKRFCERARQDEFEYAWADNCW